VFVVGTVVLEDKVDEFLEVLEKRFIKEFDSLLGFVFDVTFSEVLSTEEIEDDVLLGVVALFLPVIVDFWFDLLGDTGATREFPLLDDAIPLPLFIILVPVGVGSFVYVFVDAVGVVGILNPRGCSEVGVFALRFGLTIVGIFTVDNGCTFIGGSVSAANCCGVAIFAGRV